MVAMNNAKLDNQQRFGYHKGNDYTIPKHEETRAKFLEFANWLEDMLPEGRAKQCARTKLQETSMWANFAIAEQAPLA